MHRRTRVIIEPTRPKTCFAMARRIYRRIGVDYDFMLFILPEALLLHWSNIVGATHTDDYRIWEYGQYASRGVKEVCEFGYSSSLETDMKRNVSIEMN